MVLEFVFSDFSLEPEVLLCAAPFVEWGEMIPCSAYEFTSAKDKMENVATLSHSVLFLTLTNIAICLYIT